jgi:hypothetical protein
MVQLALHHRLFSGVSLLTLSPCQTGLASSGDEGAREVDSLAIVASS